MNLNRLYTEIILVFVLLLTACHGTAPVLHRIPLSEGIEDAALFDAGDYIDSVDYVLLEANDSCWMGDVYKIIPYRNFYYIRDLHENLFLFTDRGKFVRRIGKKGKGPGEYVTFTDFAVDPANGEVYLAALGKLMVYSMEGKLLRTEEISFDWQVFAFAGQERLVFMILNVQCELMDQELNTDTYLFDKESGRVGVFEKNAGHNGLQIDGIVYRPKAVYGNRLIGIIPATELAGKAEIRNPELQKMACQMDENANPVLAVLYMKQLGEK